MLNVQTAMQELHPDRIIRINNPVGESECNGRIENAIRRLQEKITVLRHQIDSIIKHKISDEAPIMSWLVRWAAELLSKYAIADDGKTRYERVHEEDRMTLLVPFGETVMYLPLKTVHRNKGMLAKEVVVWLGVSESTEETLIGTKQGVIKCRIVDRLSETDRWNRDNVLEMNGIPWESILGKPNHHISVDVADDGECMRSESKNEETEDQKIDDETHEQEFRGGMDKCHASKKVISKFGETSGCAACSAIKEKMSKPGRIGRHHSDECR